MNSKLRAGLVALAVLCIGVALYFPTSRLFENKALDDEMDELRDLKQQVVAGGGKRAEDPKLNTDWKLPNPDGTTLETDPSAYYADDAIPQTDKSGIPQDSASGAASLTEEPAKGSASSQAVKESLRTPQAAEQPTSGLPANNADIGLSTEKDASQDVSRPMPWLTAQPVATLTSWNPVAPTPVATLPPSAEKTFTTPEPGALDQSVAGRVSPEEVTEAPSDTDAPSGSEAVAQSEPEHSAQPIPEPTPFVFDETKILAEYKPLYEKNRDLVGWLKIDGTPIDYPVLQRGDEEYYLTRDFYSKKNANGQLILDAACDPYTPSLNLVISGHNMKSGKMFGNLQSYANERFARKHPVIEFDTLFRRGRYLVVTAFYTWDHEAREDGLRYNVDIRYNRQLGTFLDQLEPLKLYDTGTAIEFGDEMLMLSTCSYQTDDGRFVVIARRIRLDEKP